VLKIVELPKPTPSGYELLIKVIAAATKPADTKIRAGEWPNPINGYLILGFDGAGVVEAVGENVTLYKPGDEVIFAGNVKKQGWHAEYCLVDERIVGEKPKTLDWENSASIPLCSLTAYEGLVEGLAIPVDSDQNSSKSLLIVGGAGGVGSIVIQIAKKILKIGTVIATASRQDTVDWCKKLGADFIINHKHKLSDQLKENNIAGVDYCFHTSNVNDNWADIVDCMLPLGKVCVITSYDKINLALGWMKRITVFPEVMFSRPVLNHQPEKQRDILNFISKNLDFGVLHSIKGESMDCSQLPSIHTKQQSGTSIGKITFTIKF